MRIQFSLHGQINLKDSTLRIKDGGSNSLVVKIGTGDLTYTETQTITYTPDGNVLDDVREGEEVPMQVSFNFIWDYLKGSSGTPSVEDALKKRGEASAWVSSDSDTCRPYAVDLEFTIAPDCNGDQEVILLPDFRWETLNHSARNAMVDCSGRCNAKLATVTRSAQTS